jgi:hypothetical protein
MVQITFNPAARLLMTFIGSTSDINCDGSTVHCALDLSGHQHGMGRNNAHIAKRPGDLRIAGAHSRETCKSRYGEFMLDFSFGP